MHYRRHRQQPHGATGAINVNSGASWTGGSPGTALYIGYYGPGSLNIASGGTATLSDSAAYVGGLGPSGTGTVSVDSSGGIRATWTNAAGGIYVGYATAGSLSITNGALVNCTGANYIGGPNAAYAGTGAVTVDGSALGYTSTLTVANGATSTSLYIAAYGTGTLNISNGGIVNNNYINTSGTTYLSGATYVGSGAGVAGPGPGAIVFGGSPGGTLNTRSLFAAPSQLTGSGTINASGIVTDGAVTFNGSTTGSVGWTSPVAVSLNLGTAAANGALGAGYAGAGSLSITNGAAIASSVGYLGYKPGASGTAAISGSGSAWTINGGSMYVGDNGSGALYIAGGGSLNVPNSTVSIGGGASLLEVDAGAGSSVTVGSSPGYAAITGSGTLRIVAGADALASSPYTPIRASSIGPTVQAVGGAWNGGASQFIASNVDDGTPGTPLTMTDQRASFTDASGNSLGASFLASGNTITAAALGGARRPRRPTSSSCSATGV